MYQNISVEDSYDYVSKVVLVGDSGVGKTNILSRYVKDEFYHSSKATLGVEFATKIIISDTKRIKIQIWDTAGQERYKSITNSYYVNSKGALVVFDLAKPKSFESVDRWVNDFKEISGNGVSIILVGNKSDLTSNRAISYDEAKQKAEKLDMVYFETSALTNTNINEIFQKITDMVYVNYLSKLTVEDLEVGSKILNEVVENKEEEKKCSC